MPTNNATLQQSWTLCGCCSAISELIRHDQSFSAAPRWEVNFPLAVAPSMWKMLKRSWPMQAICFPCLRLVSPWEQTTAFVWTWMAVMSSAFLAFLAFLDHSAGCELSELRPWSGHGQHKLNGHTAGVSDWSGPQDIPRLRENDLQPVFG